MNPCAVYEMQFLKCFWSVQVASIFILDELRWNMIFSSSIPDRKIEYHWPSWTVSVSWNCHLLLEMLRWKIIEQFSQLLPLLLYAVCGTVILRGTSWEQGSILLDIVKTYNRRSFPREFRISVEKIRLRNGSGRNWRLEQANGRNRKLLFYFCFIFKWQFVIPSKSAFLLLFKNVFCLLSFCVSLCLFLCPSFPSFPFSLPSSRLLSLKIIFLQHPVVPSHLIYSV